MIKICLEKKTRSQRRGWFVHKSTLIKKCRQNLDYDTYSDRSRRAEHFCSRFGPPQRFSRNCYPPQSVEWSHTTHRVQKSQFHQEPRVMYDETLFSSAKTHFHENSPMILCEIRHFSRILIDFPKSSMNIHDFKRSTSVFIDVFIVSMFAGDQRTQFTCFHP